VGLESLQREEKENSAEVAKNSCRRKDPKRMESLHKYKDLQILQGPNQL
jgi:hypothetical protein